jgi:hypothetical protein
MFLPKQWLWVATALLRRRQAHAQIPSMRLQGNYTPTVAASREATLHGGQVSYTLWHGHK